MISWVLLWCVIPLLRETRSQTAVMPHTNPLQPEGYSTGSNAILTAVSYPIPAPSWSKLIPHLYITFALSSIRLKWARVVFVWGKCTLCCQHFASVDRSVCECSNVENIILTSTYQTTSTRRIASKRCNCAHTTTDGMTRVGRRHGRTRISNHLDESNATHRFALVMCNLYNNKFDSLHADYLNTS